MDRVDRIVLTVGGLKEGYGPSALEETLGEIPGMAEVKVNLAEKKVMVGFDPDQTSEKEIKATIVGEGYEVMN